MSKPELKENSGQGHEELLKKLYLLENPHLNTRASREYQNKTPTGEKLKLLEILLNKKEEESELSNETLNRLIVMYEHALRLLDLSKKDQLILATSLMNFRDQLQMEKTQRLKSAANKKKTIPLNLQMIDAITLFVSLKDGGLIDCTDYGLSKLLEENFTYMGNKCFKYVSQQVSKLRRMEVNTPEILKRLKTHLSEFNIKTSDFFDPQIITS